jgi:hypothetical protein
LTQAREVFPVHQVGAHESNEFEEAVFGFGDLLQQMQEQKATSAAAI